MDQEQTKLSEKTKQEKYRSLNDLTQQQAGTFQSQSVTENDQPSLPQRRRSSSFSGWPSSPASSPTRRSVHKHYQPNKRPDSTDTDDSLLATEQSEPDYWRNLRKNFRAFYASPTRLPSQSKEDSQLDSAIKDYTDPASLTPQKETRRSVQKHYQPIERPDSTDTDDSLLATEQSEPDYLWNLRKNFRALFASPTRLPSQSKEDSQLDSAIKDYADPASLTPQKETRRSVQKHYQPIERPDSTDTDDSLLATEQSEPDYLWNLRKNFRALFASPTRLPSQSKEDSQLDSAIKDYADPASLTPQKETSLTTHLSQETGQQMYTDEDYRLPVASGQSATVRRSVSGSSGSIEPASLSSTSRDTYSPFDDLSSESFDSEAFESFRRYVVATRGSAEPTHHPVEYSTSEELLLNSDEREAFETFSRYFEASIGNTQPTLDLPVQPSQQTTSQSHADQDFTLPHGPVQPATVYRGIVRKISDSSKPVPFSSTKDTSLTTHLSQETGQPIYTDEDYRLPVASGQSETVRRSVSGSIGSTEPALLNSAKYLSSLGFSTDDVEWILNYSEENEKLKLITYFKTGIYPENTSSRWNEQPTLNESSSDSLLEICLVHPSQIDTEHGGDCKQKDHFKTLMGGKYEDLPTDNGQPNCERELEQTTCSLSNLGLDSEMRKKGILEPSEEAPKKSSPSPEPADKKAGTNHGECISLHIGQAGIQMAFPVWKLQCLEHGIALDGVASNQALVTSSFFYETDRSTYTPRAVLMDLEPSYLGDTEIRKYKNLFHEDQMFSGKEDAAYSYARAYNVVGRERLSSAMDHIRHITEKCDNLQGFLLYHSLGGGTGSGFTARLLKAMHNQYNKKAKIQFAILPSDKFSQSVVEPYNAVLATIEMQKYSDFSFIMENNSVHKICMNKFGLATPTLPDLNNVIAQAMTAVTLPLRFVGDINVSTKEMANSLIVFPRLKYLISSVAPLLPEKINLPVAEALEQITSSCFDTDYQMLQCNLVEGMFMSCSMIFRGNNTPTDINNSIAALRRNKTISFISSQKDGIKVGYQYPLPAAQGYELSPTEVGSAACMFANSTAVVDVWRRLRGSFTTMYEKKAFIHHFIRDGMYEVEFDMAKQSLEDLEAEYNEIYDEESRNKTVHKCT